MCPQHQQDTDCRNGGHSCQDPGHGEGQHRACTPQSASRVAGLTQVPGEIQPPCLVQSPISQPTSNPQAGK